MAGLLFCRVGAPPRMPRRETKGRGHVPISTDGPLLTGCLVGAGQDDADSPVESLVQGILKRPAAKEAVLLLPRAEADVRFEVSMELLRRSERVRDAVLTLAGLTDADAESADVFESPGPLTRERLAPILVKWLQEERRSRCATLVLQNLDEIPSSMVPGLRRLAGSPANSGCLAACRLLQRVGPAGREALPELHDWLNSQNARLRIAAARSIAAIDPDDKLCVAALFEIVRAGDREVRDQALDVLSGNGPAGFGRGGTTA